MYENYKKDIVEDIFKTKVTSMFKGDYASSRAVYSDDLFVYKVFKQSKIVDQFEMFLKNYNGDLKLLDVVRDNDSTIFKFNKLPGRTIDSLVNENKTIPLELVELKQWFKNQVKEIHNAGVKCYEKYDEYKIKEDPWGQGFIFTFCDWSRGNYIYDEKSKKLFLVDLEPSNWMPRNIWDCVIREQFKSFIRSFEHIKELDNYQYVLHLEDTIQEELNNEIPMFLACPA
tara:strand:- start:23 stop:706 length:684 start_codon:yes stop_codon:yes gene_type:complete